jgi:hypothetical protein
VKALNKAEPRKVGIYNVGTGRGLTRQDFFIYLNVISICSYGELHPAQILINMLLNYMVT